HRLAAVLAAAHADAVRDARRAAVGTGLHHHVVLARLLAPRRALLAGTGGAPTAFLQCHGKSSGRRMCELTNGLSSPGAGQAADRSVAGSCNWLYPGRSRTAGTAPCRSRRTAGRTAPPARTARGAAAPCRPARHRTGTRRGPPRRPRRPP